MIPPTLKEFLMGNPEIMMTIDIIVCIGYFINPAIGWWVVPFAIHYVALQSTLLWTWE